MMIANREVDMVNEALPQFGRAPGFPEEPVDVRPKHGAGVV